MTKEYINIFGINIENLTNDEAMDILTEELKTDGLFTIATPNTEIVMQSKKNLEYQVLVNSFDMVVPDGIGLIYASKIKKLPLKERVTGFDLSVGLLEKSAEIPFNLYILAGKPGVSERAAKNIEKDYSGVTVVGNRNGYFTHDEEDSIIDNINSSNPDVIFVGLGFPKQEEFIRRNKDRINAKIIIGNGGATDIFAGDINRAPDIFIRLNLEWFYRLLSDPKRIKRQMAIPQFLFNIVVNKDSVKKGEKS